MLTAHGSSEFSSLHAVSVVFKIHFLCGEGRSALDLETFCSEDASGL